MSKSPKSRALTKTARGAARSQKGKSKTPHSRQSAGQNDQAVARNGTKQAVLINLLRCAKGASVSEMADKSGWQHHSVRGFLSGTVKKKLDLALSSQRVEGRGRVYRIA